MTDRVVSHYRILELIGEGGMGVVYKAEDTRLKRTVALKFLSKDITGTGEHTERFLREAQAAAALDHPNICTVYEINEVDGETFLAMAFLEGQALDERIQRGPLPLETVYE
ncbi:MAG: protein kinase, partial [Bryobacterales bacterium]|nr:protein kinase [Bryobacterales bacterium]